MPRWTPTTDWAGQDVFIIGGGPSLRNFDWSLLHSELTIGCNTAFTLGPQICKICVFGDRAWFRIYEQQLANFEGVVFTNASALLDTKIPWLWTMPRRATGLHHDALGWNGNTGAAAINLALLLGARRVYLLGYDMQRRDNRSNWHDKVIRPAATKPSIYKGFANSFKFVVRDWHKKFSDCEIINVTTDSGLSADMFPWMNPDKLWDNRAAMRREDLRVRQMFVDQDNSNAAEAEMYSSIQGVN